MGGAFYGLVASLPLPDRLLAFVNFVLIGGLWVVVAFLSASKSYRAIALSFLVGMSVGVLIAPVLARRYGETGALAGFTTGLFIVLYALIGRVIADFDRPLRRPFAIFASLAHYWEYTVSGLVYNAAVWSDNWVMWLTAHQSVTIAAIPASPAYDSAMFLAFLTIVPAMTLFLIAVETRFFEHHMDFYHAVNRHGTFARIKHHHELLVGSLIDSFRGVAIFQAAISYLAILMAPQIVELVHGGLEMVSIFRFGVLGAMFNFFLLSALVVMSYFDFRRMLVHASVVFLVLNVGCTYATTWMGSSMYGYGFFISAMLAFLFAYFRLSRALGRLPYMAFVANNQALK